MISGDNRINWTLAVKMMCMLTLETISCSHLRLHDGIDRCNRRLVWAILPGFTAAFAVMA